MDNVVVLPGMAIAAKDEVRSLLVVAKKPIEMAKRIALDTSSRAYGRAGAHSRRGYVEDRARIRRRRSRSGGNADARRRRADHRRSGAAHCAEDGSARARKSPSGEDCCQGEAEDMPVPGFETLFVYDVAHQWREMTGKPCVLAIWVGRPRRVTPEMVADFRRRSSTASSASAKSPRPRRSSSTAAARSRTLLDRKYHFAGRRESGGFAAVL